MWKNRLLNYRIKSKIFTDNEPACDDNNFIDFEMIT